MSPTEDETPISRWKLVANIKGKRKKGQGLLEQNINQVSRAPLVKYLIRTWTPEKGKKRRKMYFERLATDNKIVLHRFGNLFYLVKPVIYIRPQVID